MGLRDGRLGVTTVQSSQAGLLPPSVCVLTVSPNDMTGVGASGPGLFFFQL